MAMNWAIPAAPWLCFASSGTRCVFAAWLRSSRIHYPATYSARGCRCQDPFPLSRGRGRRLLICRGLTCRRARAFARFTCSNQPAQGAYKRTINTNTRRAISAQHLCRKFHTPAFEYPSTDGHQFAPHGHIRARTDTICNEVHILFFYSATYKRSQSHNGTSKEKAPQ